MTTQTNLPGEASKLTTRLSTRLRDAGCTVRVLLTPVGLPMHGSARWGATKIGLYLIVNSRGRVVASDERFANVLEDAFELADEVL